MSTNGRSIDFADIPVAVGVPAAELLAGIGLLLRPGDPGPRILTGVLAAAFAGAGIKALAQGQAMAGFAQLFSP
jgi:hypothetical protein